MAKFVGKAGTKIGKEFVVTGFASTAEIWIYKSEIEGATPG